MKLLVTLAFAGLLFPYHASASGPMLSCGEFFPVTELNSPHRLSADYFAEASSSEIALKYDARKIPHQLSLESDNGYTSDSELNEAAKLYWKGTETTIAATDGKVDDEPQRLAAILPKAGVLLSKDMESIAFCTEPGTQANFPDLKKFLATLPGPVPVLISILHDLNYRNLGCAKPLAAHSQLAQQVPD